MEYCDNYDCTTQNCVDCNWYSWWTEADSFNGAQGFNQGDYCATNWWLFALWLLGLLALLALLLACCWLCTRVKKKPVAEVHEPLYRAPPPKQEVHVQREPKVVYHEKPVYVYRDQPKQVETVRYEQPKQVEMIRYEQPRQEVITRPVEVRYEQPVTTYVAPVQYEENVRYEYGEPRITRTEGTVVRESRVENTQMGKSTLVDTRRIDSPQRGTYGTSRVVEGGNYGTTYGGNTSTVYGGNTSTVYGGNQSRVVEGGNQARVSRVVEGGNYGNTSYAGNNSTSRVVDNNLYNSGNKSSHNPYNPYN